MHHNLSYNTPGSGTKRIVNFCYSVIVYVLSYYYDFIGLVDYSENHFVNKKYFFDTSKNQFVNN